jgi:chaperonin cofactor prefoldin
MGGRMSRANGGCEICGRGNCCQSFHSLAEQEEFDKRKECEESGDCYDCTQKDFEIDELEHRAEKAESRVKAIESAWQDAELRAEKVEARVRELEAER